MIEYAKTEQTDEEGKIPTISIVVITTCNIDQQRCTHYVPLSKGRDFLLGRPTTEDHIMALGPEPSMMQVLYHGPTLNQALKRMIPNTVWPFSWWTEKDNKKNHKNNNEDSKINNNNNNEEL